jgi:hypothetical protein
MAELRMVLNVVSSLPLMLVLLIVIETLLRTADYEHDEET